VPLICIKPGRRKSLSDNGSLVEKAMAIGEICSREVVFAHSKESVTAGAQLMRKHHVGSLVIVDEKD
jgi:CBS domain-containing protein